ncbi:hypothetical protein PM082_023662 [Marasmius tenuissimus]|nr:hypothetical protein PM082_023662 [Marasmius tenuissimus]
MAPVLIVGAGPTGLALALSLSRNGVPVRIIDKRPEHTIGQRGSGMQPRTLELYKILGALPDIAAAGNPERPIRMYTSPEGPTHVAEFHMHEPLENTPEYPLINTAVLGQDKHEAVLRKRLAEDYDTHVELGTELKSFEQTDDYVESRLVKHVDGKEVEEVFRSEFLVGTDGARSVVRKQLGLTFLGKSDEQTSLLVGGVRIKSGVPDRDYWRMWGDWKKTFLTLFPFETEGDLYFLVTGGPDIDVQQVNSSPEALYKHISSTIGRDFEFGETLWSGVWSVNVRMVNKFGEGRVFVGGDAAHVHSPTGAQGMNSGVQDAINLGWKMGLVHKGLVPLSFLTSYTDERLPVIATMLNKTTELMNNSSTVSEDDSVGNAWFAKRGFELRMLGVNYRKSPVIVDVKDEEKDAAVDPYRSGTDGTIKGGDRAPAASGLVDPTDSSTTTLFDLFSPSKHTILVFSKDDSASQEILETVGGIFPQSTAQTVVVYPQSFTGSSTISPKHRFLVDKEGYAFKHYRVNANDGLRMFVIRPDAYVGAIVEGVEGLKEYTGLIFKS